MTRDKPWIFRTYSGHSNARESNALYRKNLAKGQTGLSVAFDLPTQTGYDSDHVLAKGEVGKVGVPISHLGDMRALFADIPLAEMNTSMTINATAPWLLALYIAVADEQGAPRERLQGTTQNDIVKEYLSRGTYVFPPAPSLRLTKDVILFTTARDAEVESDERLLLPSAGGRRDAGAGARLCARDRDRDPRHGEGLRRGRAEAFGEVVGRISFFVNAGLRFITELCKMRAFCELWDEITRERYGVTDPKQRLFRYGVQVNSLGLTEQQAENNVYRILIEMLAVTLSKSARARAVQLPAWNEALGLPRPFDQQWSLRMQQILAYETDLLDYGDIFDGSKEIAAKVEELKREAREELARIDAMGGAIAAVESSYMKSKLVESNTARLEAIERGEQVVVGVNKFTETEASPLAAGDGAILTVPHEVEAEQVERLRPGARARRQGGRGRAEGFARRRGGRPQRDAGLDRGGESRRHHRRMGRGAARGVRRISRADRRRPRGAPAVRRARRGARRRRARVAQARPAHQVPGRQARARRPLERRRADRGARARCRHGGGVRGHPPHAGRDRQRGAGRRRARGRAVDPVRLARAAGEGRGRAHARGRARRRAGDRRRHHPAGRRARR